MIYRLGISIKVFVISFINDGNDLTRISFDDYYMPLVEIKGFNALINSKPFFHQPVKDKQEAYKNFVGMLRNKVHTTGSLLYYLYRQNHL